MNAPRAHAETRFAGLPISGGIALARVCLFDENRHSSLPIGGEARGAAEGEKARLRQAIQVAADRLDALIAGVAERVGETEAGIFKAHRTILNDGKLVAQMLEGIESYHLNAESAITRTLDDCESRLLEVDNEYIRDRATDIGEVKRRLLDVLGDMKPSLRCEGDAHCQRGRNRIVVAEELTPSLTIDLDTEQTRGFVTERGGPASHAAILARALGIPAVTGIKNIHNLLSCGTELLINGDTGEVVAWPTEEAIARLGPARAAAVRLSEAVEPVKGLTVMANISRAADVRDAVIMKAEGIGLYRTEFEFLAAGRILDEDEQAERYAAVARAVDGQPVYFRALDIGGDKGARLFGLPREENPYLGLRGSRLLLARPDLLATQARALARAAADRPIHVMYPMVADLEQFLELRRRFGEAIADLPAVQILHGLMFEVPSACLQARELLEAADFASIGTNDLIQYLFAVDRNNERVAYDYQPDKPAFWMLVARIAEAAAELHRPLSVCGEVAADPRFLAKLMALGITAISVSPRLIPELRRAVRAAGETV